MPKFDEIKKRFNNKYYDLYANVKINYFHDDFEKMNYNEFGIWKRDILIRKFTFYNKKEITKFIENYFYVFMHLEDNRTMESSLDIIINENSSIDFYLGCQLIIAIIERNNEINFVPSGLFINHLNNHEQAKYLWELMQLYNFKNKYFWEIVYFYHLGEQLINTEHVCNLINAINELTGFAELSFKHLEKYCRFGNDLFTLLLKVIIKLNENGNKIMIFQSDFSKFIGLFGNIETIKEFYFQMIDIDSNYDYGEEIFKEIIALDISFLYEYIEKYYLANDKYHSITITKLGFVWQNSKTDTVFNKIFDTMILDAQNYSFSENPIKDFFYFDEKDNSKIRAKSFLFEYSKNNINSTVKINLVVDIILHSMRDYFEEYLLFFLSLNYDVMFFSEIYWRGQSTFGMGDVILEEIDASDWRNILSIVEKSELGIELIPVKRYISDQIEMYTRSANKRKQELFLYQY
ncbi:hypothetical protein AGMMS49928_29240 [Spirochaetia bacterium]|nr:hypothetical protein AGMMS49928_29240 [Spirochaetia bacterium]